MTARAWLRAVRARFMASSAVAVAVGLAASHHAGHAISAPDAAITLAGVLALHAGVDLLNDYWDHRRGIDARTVRTPYSGGTGVISSGALSARAVRLAGLAALGAGLAAGSYFVLSHGLPIALMLAFAAASVYLYSTRIVDSGLAEAFVGAKGALVVMGASYIQSSSLGEAAVAAGICVGALSSIVLLATSFPDREADRDGGRRTLVVAVGRAAASRVYAALVAAFGAALAAAVALGALPPACLAALAPVPLAVSAARGLRAAGGDAAAMVPAMRRTVAFARLAGAILAAGLLA